LHPLAEELPKNFLLVAVTLRVLFPDQWIPRDGVKPVKIVDLQRPELHELALERGL
jgi:hypothetical protein